MIWWWPAFCRVTYVRARTMYVGVSSAEIRMQMQFTQNFLSQAPNFSSWCFSCRYFSFYCAPQHAYLHSMCSCIIYLALICSFKASGHAHRIWLRHLQHTCKWGVALMVFLFLFSFPAPLLSLALVSPFAILYSTRVAPLLAFSPLKLRFFLRSMFFFVFRFLFHPEAHFHYFAERSTWLITEENYVEYPPNTIYVLTRLKSGSNALPGEIGKIGKISIFCDARCDMRLKSWHRLGNYLIYNLYSWARPCLGPRASTCYECPLLWMKI
jgi:hypothetical protein